MRILVLNGSPHMNGATSDMVSAFSNGANEAGHDATQKKLIIKLLRLTLLLRLCKVVCVNTSSK